MKNNDLLSLNAQFNRIVNKFNAFRNRKVQYELGHVLYPAEIQVLIIISMKPGITVSSIADELYISASAASQLVRKLTNKKYAVKKRLSGNERVVELYLTDSGKGAVNSYRAFEAKTAGEFLKHFSRLTDKEKDSLMKLFNGIEKMMDEKLEMTQ
ncbi:MAG: winged helix-turn-helix transcriptional regulator [Spirochaetes bacterium]|nr:winged helix-turn-helix transcriptional regulator [Spirochaetota bacterium]